MNIKTLDSSEILKHIKRVKKISGTEPPISSLMSFYGKSRMTIYRYLKGLQEAEKIVINKDKKGNNYYNLKI